MARKIRIAVLLGILAVVLLYAGRDIQRRRDRTNWERRLDVAIVLLRKGDVDPAAITALRERVPALETRLGEELARHRTRRMQPFSLQVFGPVDVETPPPSPVSDGFFDLADHAVRSWRYTSAVDDDAGVESRAFDVRIYLVVRPPESRTRTVEGQSEQGGRVGSVEVELDEGMVDFALFVATHELMHTLGATDKYDSRGLARAPEGLADPEQAPLFPQPGAEVMARNVVVSPGVERPPETLDELFVGPTTAREIGWRD